MHLAVSSHAFAVMLSISSNVIFPAQYPANVSQVIRAAMNSAMLILTLPGVNSGIFVIPAHSTQLICQNSPSTTCSYLSSCAKVNTPAMPYEVQASLASLILFVGKTPNMYSKPICGVAVMNLRQNFKSNVILFASCPCFRG